ncbi:MAG: hypothetical protein ABI273_06385 [Lacunisphaera sp.]
MNIVTLTATVSASRETVFNFLANIENLPKWSGGYCEDITLQRGRWWAFTTDGEQVVELESSADLGVIDFRSGPRAEDMTLTPIRVIGLADTQTLLSFILLEAPDLGPERFERRCQLWRGAVKGLLRRFGGGEMHSPEAMPQLLELGVN